MLDKPMEHTQGPWEVGTFNEIIAGVHRTECVAEVNPDLCECANNAILMAAALKLYEKVRKVIEDFSWVALVETEEEKDLRRSLKALEQVIDEMEAGEK